jgi:hypothetical protein
MSVATVDRYKSPSGYAIRREGYARPNEVARYYEMELRCPSCNGSNLKKISLAYDEGLYRVDAQSRLRGFLFGSDGPNVIVGKAVTQGVHQTQLSRRLRPPMKWSYVKLIGWSSLVSCIALVGYVHSVMSSSSKASSLPAAIGIVVLGAGFLFLLAAFWRHNQLVYPRQYAEWDESFVCQRCGGVSRQPPQEAKSSRV